MPEFASSLASKPTVGKIGDLAAEAGISKVHMLAWRDLADVEAGGSEIHASMVASLWAKAGVEVTIRTSYAQGSPPQSTRNGYLVIRRAGRYLIFPRAVLAELAGRHGQRDALVEIWNGVPFFSPLWARGPRVTWIHHPHTEMWPMVLPTHLARIGQILEGYLAPPLYRRELIVTLSESSKQQLLDRFGFRPENVHVVAPGISSNFSTVSQEVDSQENDSQEDNSKGGEPKGVDSQENDKTAHPSVVAVGRLMPVKAFDDLIEIMVRVRQAVPATLTIIGEGYERDHLEQLIVQHRAEEWCELLGRVPNETLIGQYRSAWVLASASKSEGWGMTLTEAAACGTPAVATRISGHRDAIEDRVTGILVDSADDFVLALQRLLRDADLRKQMGQQASKKASSYSWERTAYDTMAVLAASARRLRS